MTFRPETAHKLLYLQNERRDWGVLDYPYVQRMAGCIDAYVGTVHEAAS